MPEWPHPRLDPDKDIYYFPPPIRDEKLIGPPSTIAEWQVHFKALFSRRNSLYLPSRLARIDYLDMGIKNLSDAITRGSSRIQLEEFFAELPRRIFCVAEAVNDVSLHRGIIEIYPIDGCAHCQKRVCECLAFRKDVRSVQKSNYPPGIMEQYWWGFDTLMDHIDSIYGQRNRMNGHAGAGWHLYTEVTELRELEHSIIPKAKDLGLTSFQIEQKYAHELAQCLGWTLTQAKLADVSVGKAVRDRFSKGCPDCHKFPCQDCTVFNFSHTRIIPGN